MPHSRVRIAEIATLVLSVLVLLSIFVPWVETGVLDEVDTINGIDIPVLGWSSVIVTLIAIALAVAAFVLRNRWLWCAQLVVVGFMLTGATSVLMTLDVMDSAVVGWITRVLPEEMQDASPQMQATFSMWASYSLTLLAAAAGCLVVIWRSGDEIDEDAMEAWPGSESWVTPSIDGPAEWSSRNPWDSPGPQSTDKPSWM
jgi:hypothetical protein